MKYLMITILLWYLKSIHSKRSSSSENQEIESWNIPIPSKSYFRGFNSSFSSEKWEAARVSAMNGEPLLLKKILNHILSPLDLISHGIKFKDVARMMDFRLCDDLGFEPLKNFHGRRAPLSMFGFKDFSHSNFEGDEVKFSSLSPNTVVSKQLKIPQRIVGVGLMDENWGWLSTHFLNRSVSWAMSLGPISNPYDPNFRYCDDFMNSFLNDDNLIMMVVNQHHNCTHPKIISFPLGVNDYRSVWRYMQVGIRTNALKKRLLFSASSNYAFRPQLRSCVAKVMGNDFFFPSKLLSFNSFYNILLSARAVLAMPGLGYDTYRLWESLYLGAMPVIERGFGMERTFYKLPVLLVDDYAELTPFLIKQAYIESIYRLDEWEFDRLTSHYWNRLLYLVSETSNITHMTHRHPIFPEDETFTRPLVPFDCDKLGGCGPGTKRVPKRSCAIDTPIPPNYNWEWTSQ